MAAKRSGGRKTANGLPIPAAARIMPPTERGGRQTAYEMARNFCRYSAGGRLYQDLNAVVNVLMFE